MSSLVVVAGLPTRLLSRLLVTPVWAWRISSAHHGGVPIRHVLAACGGRAWRVGGGRSEGGRAVATGDVLLQAIEEGVVVLVHGSVDYYESELER